MADVMNRRRKDGRLNEPWPNHRGLAALINILLLLAAMASLTMMPRHALAESRPAREFVVPGGPVITLQDGQRIEGHIVRLDQTNVIVRRADDSELTVPRATIDKVRFETVAGREVAGALIGWKPGVYELTTAEAVVTVYSTAPRLPDKDDDVEQVVEAAAEDKKVLPSDAPADDGGLDGALAAAPAGDELSDIAATDDAAAGAQGGPGNGVEDQVAAITPNSDLEIIVSTGNGRENGAAVAFDFELSRPSEKSVVLIYATIDGTAIDGEDYQATRGVLVIKAGQTRARIEAPVIDDDLSEDDEQLGLFLTVDPTVAVVKDRQIMATIEDDDQG